MTSKYVIIIPENKKREKKNERLHAESKKLQRVCKT